MGHCCVSQLDQRVYPTLATSVGVSAFSLEESACTITSFQAWELDTIE